MNKKATAAIVLIASTVFAGATGINKSYAARMTSCWNTYGRTIDILAQRYQVPQSLILGLVFHESSCKIDAARFEPAVYNWPGVIKAAKGNKAERRFLASSWGLAQVLGITARGMGYNGGYEEFKFRSLEFGIRYLAIKKKKWGSWEDALAAFNGGDSAVIRKRRRGTYGIRVELYVRNVKILRSKYGLPIVNAWTKIVKGPV